MRYSPTVAERRKMFKRFSWHFDGKYSSSVNTTGHIHSNEPSNTEEETLSLADAIYHGQRVLIDLKEHSQESNQLNDTQRKIESLNSDLLVLPLR